MLHSKSLLIASLTLLVSGCASQVPKPVSEPLKETVTLSEVQHNAGAHKGKPVRWGGTIAKVENKATSTEVEIVSRPLYKSGRPWAENHSMGRFIAVIDGFLDPDVYDQQRQITVHGTVAGLRHGKIGEYAYRYPLVMADSHYLWKPLRSIEDRPGFPWWYYDPFFDPWYYRGYHHYPYYRW